MRGENSYVHDVRQAVALLDLSLGGVHTELGDDPFAWFEVAKPKVVMSVQAAAPLPVMAPVLPKAEVAPRVAAPAAVEIPGELWAEGEAGGVLLVVQGVRPDNRMITLAKAMLAAVGLRDVALAWVGYTGKVEKSLLLKAMQDATAQQVLVLGQAPLGILMGKNLGVEGWHASGNTGIDGWNGAAIGVTYPLDLLLKQPLFKRLAWQHLQVWGETHPVTKTSAILAQE